VKGNFVWAADDADRHLDGEVFGIHDAGSGTTALRLPSGDGRAGGDLEMWFWLRPRPLIADLQLTPPVVFGGISATGTVLLARPADRPIRIRVESSHPVAQPNPRVLDVPAGATAASFIVDTQSPGPTRIIVDITVSAPGSTVTRQLLVNGFPV